MEREQHGTFFQYRYETGILSEQCMRKEAILLQFVIAEKQCGSCIVITSWWILKNKDNMKVT